MSDKHTRCYYKMLERVSKKILRHFQRFFEIDSGFGSHSAARVCKIEIKEPNVIELVGGKIDDVCIMQSDLALQDLASHVALSTYLVV